MGAVVDSFDSGLPGRPIPTFPTLTGRKVLHHIELSPNHRHDHQLGDTLHGLNGERHVASVPGADHQLALVVAVNQTDQIAQHNTVLVAQARARQDESRVVGVVQVYGDAGGHELPGVGSQR